MTVRYRAVLVNRKPLSEQGCFELFGLCLGGNLSYDEMLAERDRLADEEEAARLKEQGKPRSMELTLEMVNKISKLFVTCEEIHGCSRLCPDSTLCDKVKDWLNEQEARLKGCRDE